MPEMLPTQLDFFEHSAPAQAMRFLLEMLGLERRGRQREALAKRQQLGQLHPSLLKSFLKSL